jgi:hypothetical protein
MASLLHQMIVGGIGTAVFLIIAAWITATYLPAYTIGTNWMAIAVTGFLASVVAIVVMTYIL